MSLIDTFKLLAFAVRQLGLILVDAIGDLTRKSLPYKSGTFLHIDHLNKVLNQHRVANTENTQDSLANIAKVTPLDIRSTSSNCNNIGVEMQHKKESGADSLHEKNSLPDRLFIKLPLSSFATRWFFSIIGSWELECHFFQHVAHDVPLRTPKTYAAYHKGSRFFLIQENLHDDPDVELFTNLDMLKGPSLELARRCLDAFAQLHAQHYDLYAAQREAILPLDHHPLLGRHMRLVSRALNQLGLAPCMKKLPGAIPADIEQAYRRTLSHWNTLLDVWFSGPLSLLHGDSHLGNFFIDGDRMGMLDFQATHWGKGIRDVQYFLTDALPAEVLAANEQDLVHYYVDRRGHYGTAIDFNKTWEEYRGFSYHAMMTIVVSIGFGALNEEQDELMKEILNRCVASMQRLDYAGWLDDTLANKPA